MKLRLKDLRTDRDKTQQDIADLLNMTRQNYARIENEMISLSFEDAIALSSYYGVSLEELVKKNPSSKSLTKSEYKQLKEAAILILELENRIK